MPTSLVSDCGAGSGIDTGQSAPHTGRGAGAVTYASPPLVAGTVVSSERTCIYCEKPAHARDMCGTHYQRWRKHGNALARGRPGGHGGPFRWEGDGDEVTYLGQHRRVEAARGFPSSCEHCNLNESEEKYEWAFNNKGDRNNVNDYLRLCIPCHKKFDAELMPRGKDHWNSRTTEEIVKILRARHAAGTGTFRSLAAEFGIAHTTVSDIIRRRTWAHVP